MADATYQKFVKRWEEVVDIPPQTLGPLTQTYKRMTKRLKIMPWPWFIGGSLLVAVLLYVVFGPAVSAIVTLLQRGF